MFEPKHGTCFHCGAEAIFPCNWKNNWFICDNCLDKIVYRLRRKKPAGFIFKSYKSIEYSTAWKPFKVMPIELIKGALEFIENSEELAKIFSPTRVCCNGKFELDEVNQLFRVKEFDDGYSPIIALSDVADYYVQDNYQEYDHSFDADNLGKRTTTTTKSYEGSFISIELKNPYVTYVEFPFIDARKAHGLIRDKKAARKIADDELSDIFGKPTSDTRKLTKNAMFAYELLLEGNPYTISQQMR
ncbi:MAG TPA: hypothetical protein DEO83_03210 [Lachnospiraceae bacterium]|nr:hypothetical protein [Lachnospiraceae bacterium]